MLGVILLAFASILLLSNLVTALSTFFLAKDLDLLVAAPVDWLRLYLAKLGETVVAFVLDGGAAGGPDLHRLRHRLSTAARSFRLVALGAFVPFLLLPGGHRRASSPWCW